MAMTQGIAIFYALSGHERPLGRKTRSMLIASYYSMLPKRQEFFFAVMPPDRVPVLIPPLVAVIIRKIDSSCIEMRTTIIVVYATISAFGYGSVRRGSLWGIKVLSKSA